mmetsp:Transcript_43298/g.139142  ORF Transcript_43298/g.139142 Transcript_43298/m.139142 type:complete len:333 (+) Transcript_43298:455-1453(+)
MRKTRLPSQISSTAVPIPKIVGKAAAAAAMTPSLQQTNLSSPSKVQFGHVLPHIGISGWQCTWLHGAKLGTSLHRNIWPHRQRMWSQPPSFSIKVPHAGQRFKWAWRAARNTWCTVRSDRSMLGSNGPPTISSMPPPLPASGCVGSSLRCISRLHSGHRATRPSLAHASLYLPIHVLQNEWLHDSLCTSATPSPVPRQMAHSQPRRWPLTEVASAAAFVSGAAGNVAVAMRAELFEEVGASGECDAIATMCRRRGGSAACLDDAEWLCLAGCMRVCSAARCGPLGGRSEPLVASNAEEARARLPLDAASAAATLGAMAAERGALTRAATTTG